MSGINIVGFYAPILFQGVGYGSESALIAAIVLGTVNLAAIVVSTLMVDRCGRRILFITGEIQMLICQVLVACVLVVTTGVSGTETMSKGYATLVLVLMCMFCAAFQLSSGCLAPLVMSEIFPTRIRAAGQSMGIAVMSTTSFVLAQVFLTMLCHLKFGAFLFHVWMACGYDRLYGSFLAGDKGNSFGL